jgi:hypothetical protein
MTWKDIEFIFNRATKFSFSKKKLFFVFPILVFCGLLIVICRGLALGANNWVTISLTFLPIFFCFTVLLALGIVLTRVYHHEVKQLPVSYRKTLYGSWDLMIGISYLSLPVVLTYLLLWTVLGIFYLIKEIPGIGSFIGVVLSFAPFLLVLASLFLSLLTVFLLFFVTPAVALKSNLNLQIGEEILKRLKENPFSNSALFFLGALPLSFISGILCLAAKLTRIAYLEQGGAFSIIFQWFFIMLPFCAVLSPAVVFFFNFSAESYVLLKRKVNSDNL